MSGLEEYVERLQITDEAERTYAAEDIGYLNLPEGVFALLARLGEESSLAVRDAIFQAFIRIDADLAIEACIGLLASEDPQLRNQAVDVLRRKGPRAIPFLVTAMRDGGRDVRKFVLDVLSGIPSSGAGEIYTAALSDTDVNVVIGAVENLGRIRAGEFRARIEELLQAEVHPMLTGACLEALVEIGQEASLGVIRRRFPELAALPDFLLAPCLKAVAALGSGREFTEVAGLLTVRGPHMRPAILGALTVMRRQYVPTDPGAELLAALQRVVEDGDPPLCRYLAVRVLGIWAIREDVCGFLVSCLSQTERLVRLGAAEALQGSSRPGLKAMAAHAREEFFDEQGGQASGC